MPRITALLLITCPDNTLPQVFALFDQFPGITSISETLDNRYQFVAQFAGSDQELGTIFSSLKDHHQKTSVTVLQTLSRLK